MRQPPALFIVALVLLLTVVAYRFRVARDVPVERVVHSAVQVQLSHVTHYDRYPKLYQLLQRTAETRKMDSPHILIFGVSTGEEAAVLIDKYLPGAHVYGVDVDEETLNAARARTATYPNVTIFDGRKTRIDAFGPYDFILANSVLCLHPVPSPPQTYKGQFPFSKFDKFVTDLATHLRVGGILMAVNTGYLVTDTTCGHLLFPLELGFNCSSFEVILHDVSGDTISRTADQSCLFEKLSDCVV